jgi:hypothetical protein
MKVLMKALMNPTRHPDDDGIAYKPTTPQSRGEPRGSGHEGKITNLARVQAGHLQWLRETPSTGGWPCAHVTGTTTRDRFRVRADDGDCMSQSPAMAVSFSRCGRLMSAFK